MGKKIITIKIGGKMAASKDLLAGLAAEMKKLGLSSSFLLIHGGGAEVTERSKELGLEPVFKDGIRITSSKEMDLVDEVLSGRVNTRLTRLFQKCGLNAVGLSCSSGKIVLGQSLEVWNGTATRTGEITAVQPELLRLLLTHGYLPLLCSTAMDKEGEGLNINADTIAFTIAAALKSDCLVFFSDIPGVLKENKVMQALTRKQAEREIKAGTISGGMLPKIRSSLQALRAGVKTIIIARYEQPGALGRLLDGEGGTRIREKYYGNGKD
jgi:acetylglutamate kinase